MKYSCYYIIHLGCLMGFTMHFYIIFGTNLLTQSPVPVSVFPLFQYFTEKEYQTESKQNETFGELFLEQKQSRGLGVHVREATTKARGRGAPSYLMATSWLPWRPLQVSWIAFVPKRSSRRFHSVWTLFDIRFL